MFCLQNPENLRKFFVKFIKQSNILYFMALVNLQKNKSKSLYNSLTFLISKMLNEIKTATITEKGQIVIPKSSRNLNGFEIGSKIAILLFEDRIELRPMSKISEEMETMFASQKVLAKDWATKKEDKSWKNL